MLTEEQIAIKRMVAEFAKLEKACQAARARDAVLIGSGPAN